ncbi:MAG: hypothetical protein DME99_02260 [Verrucomicrobia bacterium]|nr:MAG: hypothetical protein DME99_02260 [Verrucomicrobiota bacterium]
MSHPFLYGGEQLPELPGATENLVAYGKQTSLCCGEFPDCAFRVGNDLLSGTVKSGRRFSMDKTFWHFPSCQQPSW